jgi:chromosomal replication initiator protein
MGTASESDATLLWDDILRLFKEKERTPSTLAMLSSCTPDRLEDDKLIVTTPTKFVKRTIEKSLDVVRKCASEAAFQPMDVVVELKQDEEPEVKVTSSISQEELMHIQNASRKKEVRPKEEKVEEDSQSNPLTSVPTKNDSKLTFDTFVEGEENMLALQAAKGVANGTKDFNPLFIYGKSGLGKTHLLKAIQNYVTYNDSSRICVYKTAKEFISDYSNAMVDTPKNVKEAFEKNYHNIDILIIDDIQNMRTASGTVNFFFDTFNHLVAHGKQIVLAADVSPTELGMEERVSSRIASGFNISIQPPNYELKLVLIKSFYKRMKEDDFPGNEGTLTEEDLRFLAERSGTNIRLIKSFCQNCLLVATECERSGRPFGKEEIIQQGKATWPTNQRNISVEEIQQLVEKNFSISHTDLIGEKRNKEIMEPRHVAIWLTRFLTEETLAEIGKRFGGRSHATIKHSIKWVDDEVKTNRVLLDRIERMKSELTGPV